METVFLFSVGVYLIIYDMISNSYLKWVGVNDTDNIKKRPETCTQMVTPLHSYFVFVVIFILTHTQKHCHFTKEL